MSVNTFEPNQVSVTAAAKKHLLAQLEKSEGNYLRLGVKESGCNGFMYTLDYIDQPAETDICVDVGGDLTVYIAPEELPLVSGTEMDYVTEGLNSTLQFKNANAQSYCGCGESFSIAS